MIEPLNLATMAIADKVNRFLQAHYYEIQLAALQKAAEEIGGAFVQRSHSDYIPPEVEEYFALAVMLAREDYLYPKESPYEHFLTAERRIKEGYAVMLLRDILAALSALGLHLRVRPEGYNLDALQTERMKWKATAYQVTPTSEAKPTIEPAALDVSVDALLQSFFGDKNVLVPIEENKT